MNGVAMVLVKGNRCFLLRISFVVSAFEGWGKNQKGTKKKKRGRETGLNGYIGCGWYLSKNVSTTNFRYSHCCVVHTYMPTLDF